MQARRCGWWSVLVAAVWACAGAGRLPAAEPVALVPALASPAELERAFHDLPMAARRLTGPLFWLHGDDARERLEMYVGKVAEGGNGSFTAESRPHGDWLGEGWFRDLAVCLAAAKQHDLQMWIFDEKWWPSGEVAGRVPKEYGSKRLVAKAAEVAGPARHTATGCAGPGFIGVVAGRLTPAGLDGASLLDLAGSVRDGALAWDAPAGRWQVITFTWEAQPFGGRYLVDGASRDAVDWYIRTVYQPHYDRFRADFGAVIPGFFYDEPETRGDWGSDVMAVLAERGIDWKKALVAWKFQLAGEEQAAARYQYRDALAEAWGRTLYGGLSRWCREHGVRSIGHFLEHGGCYLHPDLCGGNLFQLMKYSDMGGIDAVFDQFVWGKRVTRDNPVWQTPKLGSSITHAYGKPDDVTMVEIYGARGQDLSYPEMKWWLDHMQVSGVNFIIPHSFNPRSPRDTDCPPYFYDGGYEPRWPLYRVWADYSTRLSLLLSGGRHVCPVALLYLGNSAHVGRRILPEAMSEALQDALLDCDWLPYDVFEGDTRVDGARLALRDERYRVLVMPAAEAVPYAVLAKAKAFFEAGGVVVAHGFLPSVSATLGKTSADIAALREAVWGAAEPGLGVCRTSAAGGRSYLLPEKPTAEQLQQVLTGDAGVRPTLEVLSGRTDGWLHALHRVRAGCDVFFVANQNLTGEARRFRFRLTTAGTPECWDAMRNEITAVPATRTGDQVELELTLEPNESVALVCPPPAGRRPARLEGAAIRTLATIPLVRDPAPPSVAPPALDTGGARALEGGTWVWFPEGNPLQSAPAGTRFFRRAIDLPAGRPVVRATFSGTADNAFVLFVNGREAGHGDDSAEGWRNPVELDVTPLLRAGPNLLAVRAVNATDKASPAGVTGRLTLAYAQGDPLVVRVDRSWRSANAEQPGWNQPGFDDAAWPAVQELVAFGGGPWGRLGGGLTLGPVPADVFVGHADLPATVDLAASRVCLEWDEVKPEAAARVTVNGRPAGGLIGRPFRLEVTGWLQAGRNTVGVEPFAPVGARLVVYPR